MVLFPWVRYNMVLFSCYVLKDATYIRGHISVSGKIISLKTLQQYCWDSCQISLGWNNHKHKSCSFKTFKILQNNVFMVCKIHPQYIVQDTNSYTSLLVDWGYSMNACSDIYQSKFLLIFRQFINIIIFQNFWMLIKSPVVDHQLASTGLSWLKLGMSHVYIEIYDSLFG